MEKIVNSTPDFPFLRSRLAAWKQKLSPQQSQFSLHFLQALMGSFLPVHELSPEATGPCSRKRHWPKYLIFWTFLSQVLSPGTGCRSAIRQARAWALARGQVAPSDDTSPFCQARSRFQLKWIEGFISSVAQLLTQRSRPELRWCGRDVKIIDATTCNLPDTPANQAAYPQSSSQQPGLGFPLMHVAAMFCLASGALLGYATSPNTYGELVMATGLLKHLRPGDVLLGDRLYGCYRFLADIHLLKADALMRLHASRNVDFRKAKRFNKNDALFIWKRDHQVPKDLTPELWESLPAQLTVRIVRYIIEEAGFRSRRVTLVTTLLDPDLYPPEELAKLYKLRWQVELSFRQIKTLLQMDKLSALGPDMARKELAMHLLAYQLIRAIMQESALTAEVRLDRISFQGSVDSVRHYATSMLQARSKTHRLELYRDLLESLARDKVPDRPNRREPRALKGRLKSYPRLTCHRKTFLEIPHASRVALKRAKARKNKLSLI